jgi:hypothetical protein
VYDLIVGCVAAQRVSCCDIASADAVSRMPKKTSSGAADDSSASLVTAALGRFDGSGVGLALLSRAGVQWSALCLHRAVSEYSTMFLRDPGATVRCGMWADLWLAADRCLDVACEAASRAFLVVPSRVAAQTSARSSAWSPVGGRVTTAGSVPAAIVCKPVVTSFERWGAEQCAVLDGEVEVHATTDVGVENGGALPTKSLLAHPVEFVVSSLVDVVMGTCAVDVSGVKRAAASASASPVLSWLQLCARMLASGGKESRHDDSGAGGGAAGGAEDEGETMGAGGDDIVIDAHDDAEPDAAPPRRDDADDAASTADMPGVVPAWRDLRWWSRAVAVGVVRLLLHQWARARTAFRGKELPRSAFSQIHDLLAIVASVVSSNEVGEGVLVVQVRLAVASLCRAVSPHERMLLLCGVAGCRSGAA